MDKPEWETSAILTKILNRRELDKVAPDTVKKIEKFFEQRFDDYLTTQALYETLQRNHCKLSVFIIFRHLFPSMICLNSISKKKEKKNIGKQHFLAIRNDPMSFLFVAEM